MAQQEVRRRPVTVQQCCCGYPACQDHWLVGLGKFVQGSGFTREQAERVAELVNADEAFPHGED